MFERDVMGILPESYDFRKMKWYATIKDDYDRYRFRVILVSFLATIPIPISFLIYDLYHGRTNLIINYVTPSIAMLLLLAYLVIFRNFRVMRILTILTAAVGLFLAVFLPGSHGAYVIIMFNYIPIVFALGGSRDGVRWFAVFIVMILSMMIPVWAGLYNGSNLYHFSQYSLMTLLSILMMFAIIYSGQKQHERIIRRLVMNIAYDSITGLPNKDSLIMSMKSMNSSIIAILHITNFKSLATLFGYECSDSILVLISETLQEMAWQRNFRVYKLAWHEFGLQIPSGEDVSVDEAEDCLRDMLNVLCKKKIKWEGMDITPVICIGGMIVRDGRYNTALSKADAALATGLTFHRSVTVYRDGMDSKEAIIDTVSRYAVLYDNIVSKTLGVFLQPVVDTGTCEICWHEALLRVKDSSGEFRSVSDYLEIARDTGLYKELTRCVLQRAGELIGMSAHPVSVNICLSDILDPGIFDILLEITGRDYYRPGRLILEITESEEIDDDELYIEFVRKVKRIGISIAIDDFGSGYSNFSNLMRFGVDIIKIDGALIRKLTTDNNVELMIRGIADFCRNIGRVIVAEFVENEDIYSKVRQLGIHYCQGYLFGKPSDSDELVKAGGDTVVKDKSGF